MSEEFNVNKVAAELVEKNIEKFFAIAKGVFKDAGDQIRLHLRRSYNAYLACVLDRYSKAKSFYIRDRPTHLYDFYVPVGISSRSRHIEEASASNVFSISPFLVVMASAGSGKSMLMRHLLISTALGKEKVPVFIELRNLDDPDTPLVEYIQNTLRSNKFDLDNEYIEKAMKAGHFAFFLDGFDEIGVTTRKSLGRQIQAFSESYDGNSIIVSSRPDDEFSAWRAFTLCEVDPLTLDQACKLVERLPVDFETRSKFLHDLKDRLFADHMSFLSNPLLLSIMLLTYEQNAQIPNKLSLFYSQAYEVLFQRHDALKGGFQRGRACPLDIQDYARVFSALSVQTYDKQAFQFSRAEALEYLKKSKRIVNLEFDTDDYLKDALQAVCLLVEDGILIAYSHRSFQEFFAATFISSAKPEIQEKLIRKYQNNGQDDVMHLLYEMNPELVERVYVLPGIERLLRMIGATEEIDLANYMAYLRICYTSFSWEENYEEERHVESFCAIINDFEESNAISTLVDFCWRHLRNLAKAALMTGPGDDEGIKRLLAAGPLRIAELTQEHPLVLDLAASNYWLSKRHLDGLLEIREALIERHKRAENSLEEILEL